MIIKMEEYDPHITVDPISTPLKHPDYCVRKITFDNLNRSVETPFKVFSGRKLSWDIFNNFTSSIDEKIVENGRYVRGFDAWNDLKYLLTNASGDERNQKLTTFFKIDSKLWENLSLTTLSLVFPKNPYKQIAITKETKGEKTTRYIEPFDETSIIFLLNFIYSRSKACVLVPDIKLFDSNNKPLLSLGEYLDHVDNSIRILSQWNKKPVFAPLQLNLPVVDIERILDHYAEKKYSNIWVNFLARQCDESYIANIRSIRTLINSKMRSMTPVLYYTHIQKEITPNIQAEKVPSSDILTQFNGADFVGINKGKYEDNPGFSSEGEKRDFEQARNLGISLEKYKAMKQFHKNRLFDPNSYYYYNLNLYPRDLPQNVDLLNESVNQISNGILLYSEIERTRAYALEIAPKNVETAIKKELKEKQKSNPHKSLKDYILSKQALVDFPQLRNQLTDTISRQHTLLEDLGSLGD
jgi:hypothetical protein